MKQDNIDKGCAVGCVSSVALAILLCVSGTINFFKEKGEDQVVEKTKAKIGYKASEFPVEVNELKFLSNRVFDNNLFNSFPGRDLPQKTLDFEEFQNLKPEVSFALYDYTLLQNGDLKLTLEFYLLDNETLYISDLEYLVTLPAGSKVVEVKYTENGNFTVLHTFNEHIGSSILNWLLWINNLIWAILVGLYIWKREGLINRLNLYIADLQRKCSADESSDPPTNS